MMLSDLQKYLASIPNGPIPDTGDLSRLLADCWLDLARDDGGMKPDKLHGGRMESVIWQPPVLSFTIERHGAAVMGSSRDELQRWKIDVASGTASCDHAGYRQNRATSPRLNVTPIAEEVANLIESGQRDDRLRWYEDGRVKVLVGKVIPARSAVKETVAGRRKRLRAALAERLVPQGWSQV